MNDNGKIVTALLAGLAAGAVLGIIFAPEKGSETREKLNESLADLGDAIKERAEEQFDQLSDFKDKIISAVKTKLGKIKCLKFSPSIKPGRVFRKDSKLYLWITDDGNRVPVKAQVEILVGAVTMEISSADGLKYPLAKIN